MAPVMDRWNTAKANFQRALQDPSESYQSLQPHYTQLQTVFNEAVQEQQRLQELTDRYGCLGRICGLSTADSILFSLSFFGMLAANSSTVQEDYPWVLVVTPIFALAAQAASKANDVFAAKQRDRLAMLNTLTAIQSQQSLVNIAQQLSVQPRAIGQGVNREALKHAFVIANSDFSRRIVSTDF